MMLPSILLSFNMKNRIRWILVCTLLVVPACSFVVLSPPTPSLDAIRWGAPPRTVLLSSNEEPCNHKHAESILPPSLEDSFRTARSLILESKHVNKLLVTLGKEFGSIRRRFDRGSTWVRNATFSQNVVPYLVAHGLNQSTAQYEASRPYIQSYTRDSSGNFVVDTDFGRRIATYSNEFSETVPTGAVLYNGGSHIQRTCEWKENVHTTNTHNGNGSTEVTRRFLNFASPTIISTLVVQREFQPNNNGSGISCTEVFERVYTVSNCLETLMASRPDEVLVSPLQRVSGCVANVNVQTTLVHNRVLLDGEADAIVSRGLLALLSQVLENIAANDVLELDPDSVADELHLRTILSQGRNDGLASMVRVVQSQIRQLIHPSESIHETEESTPATLNGKSHQPTAAMLLSGGVDSSVALNILKRQNYNVTAFYLKIWLEDELAHLGQCPWEDDYRVCQQVCQQAGVPLETISLQDEYKDQVISYTVQEAKRGRTPNPDVMCNSRVKFGCFYNAIEGRGFDYVASGHYAQLATDENGVKRLLRAPDPVKDQSYFLCALTQDQLDRVLFPIGEYEKTQVRELAQEFDLPNKYRPDSQGLCFLGKVKFDEFLAAYLGERPGDIVDARTGDVLGRHRGVWYHTVGQRKGIGKVLNPKATSRGPWYVVAKDPEHDIVYASNEYDEEVFTEARSDFYVEDVQWIAGSPPNELIDDNGDFRRGQFHMKIRHGPRIVKGSLHLTEPTAGNVKLDSKDGGLAPGQYVAFYELDGSECFGGGVISERHWAKFLLNRHDSENVMAA